MYTRDYTDGERLEVPMGYGGTLLDGREIGEESGQEHEESAPAGASPSHAHGLGGLFSRLPLGNFLSGIHIGWEELLIIAAALFLFLSKDGDKECAIMLAILLFIT